MFGLLALFVLVLAVMAVRMTPALTYISIGLGIPVVILTVLEGIRPGSEELVLVSSLFHAAFYFYTAYALIRYMIDDHFATRDELYATGACFTVVAWAFAYLFAAVQIAWPESFTAALAPTDARTWIELLFLSVTTLTSTGLSDVVPVEPHARAVVMLEQIAGMLYLAMVVARIVALTTMRQAQRAEREAGTAPASNDDPDD